MAQNGSLGHFEDPANPWYTPAGAEAGQSSVLAYPQQLPRAAWEGAVYHRTGILHPRLRTSGFDASGGFTCMRVYPREPGSIAGSPTLETYPWPPDGMTGVPLRFDGGERPNPCDAVDGSVDLECQVELGFLLSVNINGPWESSFFSSTVTEAWLVPDGGPAANISAQDSEEHGYLDGGVAIFPIGALQPATWYTAHVAGLTYPPANESDDTPLPFSETWRFRTADAPAGPRRRPHLKLRRARVKNKRVVFPLKAGEELAGHKARVIVRRWRWRCATNRDQRARDCRWRDRTSSRKPLRLERRQLLVAGRRRPDRLYEVRVKVGAFTDPETGVAYHRFQVRRRYSTR